MIIDLVRKNRSYRGYGHNLNDGMRGIYENGGVRWI